MNRNKKTQKVLGILGGMGPYATVFFLKRILKNTPIKKDIDHFRVLVDNQVKIPSRTRAVLFNEESPVPEIIKSINNLAQIGADLVLLPCNSVHFFYDDVIKHIKIPWINMLDCVAKTVLNQGFKKPLILGGYVTTQKIYSDFIKEAQYLKRDDNICIEKIIEEIKLSNNISTESRRLFKKIIKKNINRIDSIIFACTELPICFDTTTLYDLTIFDSVEIYSQESKNYGYF